MVWHYQTTPGENWDYTATQKMILADLTIDGRSRPVLMQAPKNGFFYVLDRATGELLSAEPYVPVNWASHVYPETGRPVETVECRFFAGMSIADTTAALDASPATVNRDCVLARAWLYRELQPQREA